MDKPRATFKLSAASLSQQRPGNVCTTDGRFLLSSGQLSSQGQPKLEPETLTPASASVSKPEQQASSKVHQLSTPQTSSASQARPVSASASRYKRPSSAIYRGPSTPKNELVQQSRSVSQTVPKSKRPTSVESRSAATSKKASASQPQSTSAPRSAPQMPRKATASQSCSKRRIDSDSEDSDDLPIGNMRIEDDVNLGADITNNNDYEDSDSDGSSIDSETFKESYQNLTMDAKKIGKQLQYEKLQKSKEIMDNVREGQGLAVHMGCSSTKAITAWDHTAAIAETVAAQARQCGTVCNIFSAGKYMDLLIDSCKDDYGDYDPDLLSQKMAEHYVGCSRLGTPGMATMLGLVDFTEDEVPEEPSQAHKPRKRIQFSQKLTQHEVVNSQIKQKKDAKEKNKTLTASRRKSAAIRSSCEQRGKTNVPLVAFGMSGAEVPGDFLQNVFDVAVAARDGYASLENPVDPDGYRPENNHQLVIQGTEPPATYSEGTLDVRRNQHIVSFSAKQMREMLCKKKVEHK